MQIQEILDALSQNLYGIKRSDAHTQGICIKCKQTPKFRSTEGRQEYKQSALCEPCFEVEVMELDS